MHVPQNRYPEIYGQTSTGLENMKKPLARRKRFQPFRGAKGIRTPDPLHAMEMRYQLRHSPVFIDQLFANLVYNTTECRRTQNMACRT